MDEKAADAQVESFLAEANYRAAVAKARRETMRGGVALLAMGLMALAVGLVFSGRQLWMRTWPTAEATITRSQVRTERRIVGPALLPNQVDVAVFDVAYTYTVDGTTYVGTGFDGQTGPREGLLARTSARQYPVGRQVEVIYNPWHPAEAYLTVGDDGPASWVPALGLLFVVLGVILVVGMAVAPDSWIKLRSRAWWNRDMLRDRSSD